jgi:hypothetical protein
VSRRVIQDVDRGTGNPTVESLNNIGMLFGLQVGFVRIRRPLVTLITFPNSD